MKQLIFYTLLLSLPHLLLAQYERISGLHYGNTQMVEIDSVYYAGQHFTVYESDDQGDSWSVSHEAPVRFWVGNTFAYDSLLYISDVHGGILRSSDRGESYTRVSDSLFGVVNNYYQFNENDIYAYSIYYMFISHDNGEHFDHFTTEGTTWGCYYDGSTSYILTGSSPDFGDEYELYRSPDHFQTTDTIDVDLQSFTEKPSGGLVTFHDKVVFGVDAFTRLYISGDQGATFETIDLVDTDETFNSTVNRIFPTVDTLFVATDQGAFKSGDPELEVWELVDFPFDGHFRGTPLISDIYKIGEVLMVELDNASTFRRDRDGEWKELIDMPDFNAPETFHQLGDELLVRGYDNKLYHSRDGANSFEFLRSPVLADFSSWSDWLEVKRYGDVTFAYDISRPAPLYRYQEGEENVEEVLPLGRAVELFNDTLWALDETKLYISADEGQSWEQRADFTNYVVGDTPGFSTQPRGVYKTGNNVVVLLSGNVEEGLILYSDDNGLTYTEVWSEGLMAHYDAQDSIIVVNYEANGTGIIVSEDAGATWELRSISGDNDRLRSIVLQDSIILTNTLDIIYFSTDLGRNWYSYPQLPEGVGFLTSVGYHDGNWLVGIFEPGGFYKLNESLIECADGQGEGCALITGRVFLDGNDNCTYETSDAPLHPYLLQLNPGGYRFSTDTGGLFSIGLSTGTYELSAPIPPGTYWQHLCPASGSFELTIDDEGNTNSDTLHFALQPIPAIYDLEVNLVSTGDTRINEPSYFTLSLTNQGTEPTAATLDFTHPASLSLVGSTRTPDEQDETNLSWNIPNLAVGEQLQIELEFLIDNDVDLIGQMFQLDLAASILEEDQTPNNNVDNLQLTYNGAYDPNDKQVEPKGQGENGAVALTDTSFIYTIRFQNTGNDIARRVRLLDTLASIFDPLSFRMIAASHDYQFSLEDNQVLRWDFIGIDLPDSTTNEAASHGFVTFSIKLKEALSIGERIRNQAAIYFDANPPIFTNTTLNTVSNINKVRTRDPLPELEVFPNPNRGTFRLNVPATYQGQEAVLSVYNVAGQLVHTQQMIDAAQQNIVLTDLAAGVYLLRLSVDGKAATEWTLVAIQ